jgi:hypothetical protein
MDTTHPATHNLLATAWAHLIQAYDALRAEEQPAAARRCLALAKQIERLHGKVIAKDNATALDAVDEMLAVAGKAWGE